MVKTEIIYAILAFAFLVIAIVGFWMQIWWLGIGGIILAIFFARLAQISWESTKALEKNDLLQTMRI